MTSVIRINDTISIEDWELTESFIRSSGPGGQNVNKVSSAVELRFEAARTREGDWVFEFMDKFNF